MDSTLSVGCLMEFSFTFWFYFWPIDSNPIGLVCQQHITRVFYLYYHSWLGTCKGEHCRLVKSRWAVFSLLSITCVFYFCEWHLDLAFVTRRIAIKSGWVALVGQVHRSRVFRSVFYRIYFVTCFHYLFYFISFFFVVFFYFGSEYSLECMFIISIPSCHSF